MGLKESNVDQPNVNGNKSSSRMVIGVKPECLSCSSSPLNTLSAFKIACLGYTPSEITLD